MALVVDGAVSGTLPERVAFAINYPGYPSSVSSAIETLGGDEGLAKARSSEANFLELKFRPQDPFAHPAFGELRHSSDLVLRISRSSQRDVSGSLDENSSLQANLGNVEHEGAGQSRRTEGTQTEEVKAEIVARVEHTYSFDGMADYQYVMAVHASGSKPHKRRGSPESSVADKGNLLDIESGDMMMLVPPLFSVKDIPEEIFCRPNLGKKKRPPLLVENGETVEAPVANFALDFKIKAVPPEGNWELKLARGSEPWLRTAALVRLFQERPIWTRNMLYERLVEQGIVVTDYYLRILLFRIAYYFGCGPFRNLWVKNGYDPRLDPESRAFQMIDFRVPIPLRGGQPEDASLEHKASSFMDMCAFKVVPHKKFTQFQLVDLQDDDIQAQIEKPPERKTCSEKSGWFRLSTIRRLRQILRMRFLALFPGDIARALETAERRGLERFRFTSEIDREDQSPSADTQGPSQAGQMDCYRIGGVDLSLNTVPRFSDQDQLDEGGSKLEDDEEEEEDEEDMEEDLDQFDGVGLRNHEDEEELEEDVELPSQEEAAELQKAGLVRDYVDPAENIPKNYLQVLLGKFSFNDSGSEQPGGAELNIRDEDAEYTIYEQDEDDDEDEDD